ncbi:unnamed protein product [Dicrocoelium dendriticum]|nr:unnamed protein product [Dicrocoelium dendriticum]
MAGMEHQTHRRQEVVNILDMCYTVFDCAASLINRHPELKSELQRSVGISKICAGDRASELNTTCCLTSPHSEDKENQFAVQRVQITPAPHSAFTPIPSALHLINSNTEIVAENLTHQPSTDSRDNLHQKPIPSLNTEHSGSLPKTYCCTSFPLFSPTSQLTSTPISSARNAIFEATSSQSEIDSGICMRFTNNNRCFLTPQLATDCESKSEIWRPYLD